MSDRKQRGIVLVMVIGVLAMLFVIGSTLLIVSRFERQTAVMQSIGRNIEAVGVAVTDPAIIQLYYDILGTDGVPYNRGWASNGGDPSLFEDWADFAGYLDPDDVRNGDLLLSSTEPYWDGSEWRWFAVSWAVDAGNAGNVRNVKVVLTHGPNRDADADGLRDSADSGILGNLSAMFGGGYELELRILPHGGMVLLDPLTHRSLLAQVIHPRDIDPGAANYSTIDRADFNAKLSSLAGTLSSDPGTDEGRLRRRFMLPPFGWSAEPSSLVQLLPVSLGYADPANPANWQTNPVHHWWPFDDNVVASDRTRWQTLLTPGDGQGRALTDAGYAASTDQYDRRHLITAVNSDDILRRQRDEHRLEEFTGKAHPQDPVSDRTLFFEFMNPDVDGATDAGHFITPTPIYFDYGRDESGQLRFNGPGLRSRFSLRDVLEVQRSGLVYNEEANPSLKRMVQLTAYFLAMIQHTSVPGSNHLDPGLGDLVGQLRTAAQLAVNTIDFADADQTPTCFQWPAGSSNPAVKVVGVEKQPFITEVYAKVVYAAEEDKGSIVWRVQPSPPSIYAVELYNPYDQAIHLDDYALNVPPAQHDLSGLVVPARRHVVIASYRDDQLLGVSPFIPNAVEDTNLFIFSDLSIDEGQEVELIRLGAHNLTGPDEDVVVDRIMPVNSPNLMGVNGLNGPATPDPDPNLHGWTRHPDDTTPPAHVGEQIVRDSSLQRHKELDGQGPVFWHCTLSRQMLFSPDAPQDDTRPAQHSLLGNYIAGGPPTPNAGNQAFVAREFTGVAIPGAYAEKPAIAAFPIVTADRGVASTTGGTLAFPTTGTLLLVTRYAHLHHDQAGTSEDKPVTVAATEVAAGSGRTPDTPEGRLEQMQQLDNGHLPIFDTAQRCTDRTESPPQGRLDVPWGQLVFDYFTALPLQELVRTIGFSVLPPPLKDLGVKRMIDLADADYENAYAYLFPDYSLVEPVEENLGPRVRGRININFAPWWVLDGLPVLPDALVGTSGAIPPGSTYPLAGVCVPEVVSGRLDADPTGVMTNPNVTAGNKQWDDDEKPGAVLMKALVDEVADGPPLGLPNVSPKLAKYMVSYRENRVVGGLDATTGEVGFVTVGALCDVLTRIPIPANAADNPVLDAHDSPKVLADLRNHLFTDPGPDRQPGTADDIEARPFSYLGYLQLVAPVVRLQDWATVKNHVFTVYATIRTTSDPQIKLRTQVTVDRTRCLYSPNELPVRIAETEPIAYSNAIED